MKLIIDIPDNQYNQICELRLHNQTIYDDAIRNGIPLEKIMDEIDAQIDLHDTPFEIDDGMDTSFCDGLNKAKEIIAKGVGE